MLLRSNADPELATGAGSTPLYIASQNGRSDAAKLLLAAKANIHSALHNVTTPLMGAISNGHTDLATHLLESGASPHCLGPVSVCWMIDVRRVVMEI